MTRLRSKTIVSRSRVQASPQHSDSEDANGGSGFEGDDGTRRESPEANENVENEGGNSRQEKSPTLGDNVAGDTVYRSMPDACIVCDGEDNKVLTCHEIGCSVAIHRSCMPDEPNSDDLGNFYCPYCWYKHLVMKSLKLQEKVMASEKCTEARETVIAKETENVIAGNTSFGMKNTLNPCERRVEDGELDDQCEEVEKSHKDKRVVNSDERGEGGECQKRRLYEEGDHASSISSPISTSSVNESDTSNQTLALVMHSRVVEHEQPIKAQPLCRRSSSKKPLFQPEKFAIGNKICKEKNAAGWRDLNQRNHGMHEDRKRKPLFWTPQEEEMLKVGVEKFSAMSNRNIPWRKILEFGQNVFRKERTPGKLKDKWKKMNKTS